MNNKCSTLLWLLILVPLIGTVGCEDKSAGQVSKQAPEIAAVTSVTLPELIYDSSEHFSDIDSANLDGLLNRIGDSRLVLLGETTHGTAEFYDMRARITRELIEKKGFTIIAVEADWPDASNINHFINGSVHEGYHKPHITKKPFSDFPSWMWRNHSVVTFTQWLKSYNQRIKTAENVVSFYGLDFYNIFSSMEAVLDYLYEIDPYMADSTFWRYTCLMPWAYDPSLYSHLVQSGKHQGCENEAHTVLQALRNKQVLYKRIDAERYFNAEQNARLIRNAEHFYRTKYYINNNSWNQRDQNMFETLQAILNHHGQTSKAVVWAHNSHIGDARATDMSARGDFNLGQRVRETFGDSAYLIGFGTDHGTVAAASEWGEPMKVMQVRPSHKDSYERLFHDVKTDNFLLPLRKPIQDITRKKLLADRLERAIGTTYDPEDELEKHYFYASLPRQFDEYIWFDETRAVKPLSRETINGGPDGI